MFADLGQKVLDEGNEKGKKKERNSNPLYLLTLIKKPTEIILLLPASMHMSLAIAG